MIPLVACSTIVPALYFPGFIGGVLDDVVVLVHSPLPILCISFDTHAFTRTPLASFPPSQPFYLLDLIALAPSVIVRLRVILISIARH